MSSIQRITGTNSGLDVDALVTAAMKTYKTKVDKEVQNQKVLEYQQEQYKQIMSDATDFYDKYFDILKTGSLKSDSSYQTESFTSSDKTKVIAKGYAGSSIDNYTINVTQLASKATHSLSTSTTSGTHKIKIGAGTTGEIEISFDAGADGNTTVSNYNTELSKIKSNLSTKVVAGTASDTEKAQLDTLNSNMVTAKYSEFTKSVVFTAGQMGKGGFTFTDSNGVQTSEEDKYLEATLKNSKGDIYTITSADKKTNDVYIDNVQFSFKASTVMNTTSHLTDLTDADVTANNATKVVNGAITTITSTDGKTTTVSDGTTITTTKIGTDGEVTKTITLVSDGTKTTTIDTPVALTGERDVKELKDKIVGFVNDYNKFIQSMNTRIFETRNKDYMPLTDEQKKDMSESQITAWEKKAQTGLLRKDEDLERIVSEMKSAMSTVMSGTGLSLESIGIKPVKNYTDKNGTLTIPDEDKLTKAIEDNAENIKDLFTRVAGKNDVNDKGGVITQLSAVIKSEFKDSNSLLSKKVGFVGTSTEANNTLTNNIRKKKQLIIDLNKSLTTKENALYKKYSVLETAMEKLNAQKSSLSSMLGQS